MAQGQQSLPASPASLPGLPENADTFEFVGWGGIDTKPPRPGVADDKCSWADNIMFLGDRNARAIPDCGAAFYTAAGGKTIIHFDFFGLQPAGVNTGPYAAVFLSDGSALAIRLSNAAQTTIAAAATFSPPAGTAIATRQYGTKYLLIATLQAQSAFWVWDGSILYAAGTLSPEFTLASTGTAYSGTPTVAIIGGTGSGAALAATVFNNSVSAVTVTNSGSGWVNTDPVRVGLVFSGGSGGNTAYGHINVVKGVITGVIVLNGGGGYTGPFTVNVADATGSGANLYVTGTSGGGNGNYILGIGIWSGGSGYSNPTITVTGATGSAATFVAELTDGVITSYTMDSVGSGYTGIPAVHILTAAGSGATTATPILSAGTITGIVIHGNGVGSSGYVNGEKFVLEGGGPASGTMLLMPFGVQGNAIEAYQSRAWILTTYLGVKGIFTAPGSAINVNPSDGGGAFPATDSVLRYAWVNLLQSNGFLYLIGDSSVNYISGVQTTGSPAITNFSNLNVDPQIGAPWRDSVQVFSRSIVMANPFGIHAIYGGAVTKISTPLDGVFSTGNINNVLNGPSSAVAEIFGVHVYMLLMPITDPISGSARNALFMWDGKRWWAASQHVALTKIATQEWGSTINAWGTDGTSLYQLFTTPSTNTTKTIQSKLWLRPSIIAQKKDWKLYAMWKANATSTLNFTIDTENTSTAVTQGPFSLASGIGWASSKMPDCAGFSMGFTMTSTSADFSMIDVTMAVLNPYRLKT